MFDRAELTAPPGWVVKHIADVRVEGEPYAGTGMGLHSILPKTKDAIAFCLGGDAGPKDVTRLMAWLRGATMTTTQPKKLSKIEVAAGKTDVWTWRGQIGTVLKNRVADWDYMMTGPVILRATFLMPRPKSLKDGGRLPYVRVRWRDLDNLMKPAQDAITESGLWEDDAQLFQLDASKWVAASNESAGLELSMWELLPREDPLLFD